MLDWQTLLRAHAFVPVWYWPVLWHYLARLEATAALARAEGRGGFGWELSRKGVIRVTHWPESKAERAARGALPRDFDYTPWLKLDPDALAIWAAFAPSTGETPPGHHGCTAHALPVHHPDTEARGPPGPTIQTSRKPHLERSRRLILSEVEGRGGLTNQHNSPQNRPARPAARPPVLVLLLALSQAPAS